MNIRHIAALGATAAIATAGAVALPTVAADAATSGKISFTLVQAGVNNSQHAVVVIHGAINGGGKDDSQGQHDTIHLPGGTLRINHPNKDGKFTQSSNPKTCYFTFAGTGSYTMGHGTGKYKGVTGAGTYTLKGSGVAAKKNGKCNFQGNKGSYVGYANGHGTVTLP